MNFESNENSDRLLFPHEYQSYSEYLSKYINVTLSAGAEDFELEARSLLAKLQKREPLKLSYVQKIIGQLGDPYNRSSHYH